MTNHDRNSGPRPCGSWASPIHAGLAAGKQCRLEEPQLDGETIYWLESRPWEQGRNVLMCRQAEATREVLPSEVSARSQANEYGGGSYTVASGQVYYVDAADQRVYHIDTLKPGNPQALTPEGPYRFADFRVDPARQRLIGIQEDHGRPQSEPVARLVAIPLDGSQVVTTLAEGCDFYSSPALSPDGGQLAWLSWNHPAMPWDRTQCNLAQLDSSGMPGTVQVVAGAGDDESLFQPQWSPAGELYLVSDRSNWWNLYRVEADELQPVATMAAEFATPQWQFAMSTYGFESSGHILATYTRDGTWHLCRIDPENGTMDTIATPCTDISQVTCNGYHSVFLGASSAQAPALWRLADGGDDIECQIIARSTETDIARAYISQPQPLSFATGTDGKAVAHGFYYPPSNADFAVPAGELPPLLVMCHGGPTGATATGLSIKIQYWTSRGFAVLDVNYRGSTGYGRDYRNQLKGQWGVADVEDVCAGAEYLVQRGLADPARLAIRGSSAGGYTVLAALTFRDTFSAGASLYGIGDLATLASDTHKFEARYLDSLVGPWPGAEAVYRSRSPIRHVELLTCPVIFLQGLDDKVVPPNQAEAMVSSLKQKGIAVAYLTFPGEGHGFRRESTIRRALEAEYMFYSQVFGFEPGEDIEPVALA